MSPRDSLARHRELGEKILLTGRATLSEMVELSLALFGVHTAYARGELTATEIDLPFFARMRQALRTVKPQPEERC